MADEVELSRKEFERLIYEAMISCEPRNAEQGARDAAQAIWKLVSAHIEETENRIIDAEFKATDLENRLRGGK